MFVGWTPTKSANTLCHTALIADGRIISLTPSRQIMIAFTRLIGLSHSERPFGGPRSHYRVVISQVLVPCVHEHRDETIRAKQSATKKELHLLLVDGFNWKKWSSESASGSKPLSCRTERHSLSAPFISGCARVRAGSIGETSSNGSKFPALPLASKL